MSTDLLAVAARARIGLLATFFFMGVVSMAWVARIPEIRDANGLNNGQLGLILIASTIGAVIGAQLTGRLVHSYGTKAVIRIAIIIMPIGLILMGFSTSPITLIFGLFIMGLGYSSMDIASNTQAVVIEKLLGRRVMSTFHALWSSGAFATTVLGGSIAKFVSPRDNLVGVGIVCFFLFIPAMRMLLSSDLDEHNGGEEETEAKIPFFGKSVLPLWGMGIGLLGGLIAEGAASDWGAILLRDDMGFGVGVCSSSPRSIGYRPQVLHSLSRWVRMVESDMGQPYSRSTRQMWLVSVVRSVNAAVMAARSDSLMDTHHCDHLQAFVRLGGALSISSRFMRASTRLCRPS
jgi:MFS family permease